MNLLVNLGINKKISIIFVVLVSGGLWFYSVFAQDMGNSTDLEKTKLETKISEFNNLLNIGITAPMTALSLTGATFLSRSAKNESDDLVYSQLIRDAKKNLIKAFILFLACTIAIFVFDFIQLFLIVPHILFGFISLMIQYPLLFVGFGYLAVAAKKMYITQAK